ncbi:MAG: bifunctional pyr operon transcriptional regulator/uracil phosphoribosyltransferase PyrR [Lachnospiraceae bacterium]|nr:bifunctional pyr operon transcriptional regulator/uracil phosphoribosyltransferase PyrR [Lachnospiraceae bacterium]
MVQKSVILDEASIKRSMMRITHEIIEHYKGIDNLCLVGIKRRGTPLAKIINENLLKVEGKSIDVGEIDISLYRDDLTTEDDLQNPLVRESRIGFDINGKDVVLVDDVVYTGRTARAAMEAIFSNGRPASVSLAVLVDRGHRELPISANFVGKNIPTKKTEIVSVHVPQFDGDLCVLLSDKE